MLSKDKKAVLIFRSEVVLILVLMEYALEVYKIGMSLLL